MDLYKPVFARFFSNMLTQNSMDGLDRVVAITHYVGQVLIISIVFLSLRGCQERELSHPSGHLARSSILSQWILSAIVTAAVTSSRLSLVVGRRLAYSCWGEIYDRSRSKVWNAKSRLVDRK